MLRTEIVDSFLRKTMAWSAVLIAVTLAFVVAYQQNQIHVLREQAMKHDEFIKFMEQGKRFNLQDGKALFMMCTEDRYVSPEIKNMVWGVYADGETDFSTWMREQDVCKSK